MTGINLISHGSLQYIFTYTIKPLNQPAMEQTSSGLFTEMAGLGSRSICTDDRNKAIDIRMLLICGDVRLERFECTCVHVYVYIFTYTQMRVYMSYDLLYQYK